MLTWPLQSAERLLWQGRPAPRCYVFRCWRSALTATGLALAALLLLWLARPAVGGTGWLVTLLLAVTGLVFGPGRLLWQRRRWECLFYALTDRRLLVRRGDTLEEYPLVQLSRLTVRAYGRRLASIDLVFGRRPVVLECLEEPQAVLAHLHTGAPVDVVQSRLTPADF